MSYSSYLLSEKLSNTSILFFNFYTEYENSFRISLSSFFLGGINDLSLGSLPNLLIFSYSSIMIYKL